MPENKNSDFGSAGLPEPDPAHAVRQSLLNALSWARDLGFSVLIAVILNGLVMFNVDPVWTNVVVGAVLIAAIFTDTRINWEKTEY